MIRLFSRRLSSALNVFPLPAPALIPPYTEIKKAPLSSGESDEGYRIMVDVCHITKTIYIDEDMCDYDKLNDLPRIVKAFGCLYPNYNLKS